MPLNRDTTEQASEGKITVAFTSHPRNMQGYHVLQHVTCTLGGKRHAGLAIKPQMSPPPPLSLGMIEQMY